MCGIGGFYNCSGARTPVSQAMSMWMDLADRGRQASGFALVGTNGLYQVHKSAISSVNFAAKVSSAIPKQNVRTMLFHTRYATKGATEENGNNHPITSHDIVMTHNGVLYNDDFVFTDLNVERENEVDSEAINAALRYSTPHYLAEVVEGSMSIVWFDDFAPEIVHLFTNGRNPLVIARTEGGNVVWASGLDYIVDAGFNVKNYFHATPFKVYTLSPSGKIKSKFVSNKRAEADKGFTLGEWSRRGLVSKTKKNPARPTPTFKQKRAGNKQRIKGNDMHESWLAPWIRDGGETVPEDWAWKQFEGWVRRDSV